MSGNTSIGRGPAYVGNEDHDGDATATTLGETVGQEPPAGNEAAGDTSSDTPGDKKPGEPPQDKG